MTVEQTAVDDPVQTGWRRLDGRMLVVGPAHSLVRLLPVIVVLLVSGRGDVNRLWIALGISALLVVFGVVRWRTTQYRITPDRVELHHGWLRRQRRSVPRDRIRTVDLTSKLLHRMFGLSVVHVGAGARSATERSGRLVLDAVSTGEAERLRLALLDHSPARVDSHAAASRPSAPPEPAGVELARLNRAWIRYAPLTFSALAGVGAVFAAVHNLVDDLGVDPRRIRAVNEATDQLAAAPLWAAIAVVLVVLVVIAMIGSTVLWAERWWGYRLSREPDGTLLMRRGLLTRRSLSVAQHRLRGAELTEPLLLRLGRAAQSRALTTGLSKEAQGGAVAPPTPRSAAHRVVAEVLRAPAAQSTAAPLLRHPRAAVARRLTRALGPAALLAAAGWLLADGVPALSWLRPAALVLVPLALLLGLDRARNLGHALTGRFLVTRQGSLVRRTVALERDGVIGWQVRQSVFQRRSGLVTLEAVTAAGRGGYHVLDVDAAHARELIEQVGPGLLSAGASRTSRG
ncbi:PH domain-containing protein [Pseudonocardia acidicola]|uniref:PH domain-containing protein n=1 Tax=Pseudonocardia acidicola TaxID=2724939 RepID=A0ABX1SIG3_9PSEU|nr:PH domain-containing protein [Pseudonocardia acidicola]